MRNTANYSGSNLRFALSASAFAVASTMPAAHAKEFPPIEVVRADDDRYSTIALVDNFPSEDATDPAFVLDRAGSASRRKWSGSIFTGGSSYHLSALDAAHVFPAFAHSRASQKNIVRLHSAAGSVSLEIAAKKARDFFMNLPSEWQSPLTEEVIAVFFVASGQPPKIDRIEDMTTLDVASQGKSISVLIEEKLCAISSFSKNKELKATFAVESADSLDEFKELLASELSGLNV